MAAVFASLTAVAVSFSNDRPLWGDEGTYVAMAASLTADRDLAFTEDDLSRLQKHRDDPTPTVILQQTERGITFSKPILYALLSAPLYALVGEAGLVVTNILVLAIGLGVAWRFLRPRHGSRQATWILITCAVASVLPVYLSWKMSDLVLMSLTLAGLVLALGGRRSEKGNSGPTLPFSNPGAALAGGAILGAATSMRFTAAAFAAAAVLALILDRRWQRGLKVGLAAAGAFLVVSALTAALLGTANPYKAVRSSFNQATTYPAGESLELASERFETRPATQSASWRPRLDLRRTGYSTLYFFVGRHTGILLYFPAAVLLLAAILRRPDRVSLSILAGVLAMVGFYLLWMPENYFGGSTFVGNRYFLGAFPALLVVMPRFPSRLALAATWALAIVGWASAVHSANLVTDLDTSSQRHAHAGIFRLLPFESTAQRIDGLTERFWAGDMVRFVDPFVSLSRWRFRLDADLPSTEVLVASDWDDQPLYFVVSPSTAEVNLEIRDWRGHWQLGVPQPAPEPPGLLSVPASRPWRWHAYWWKPGKLYGSRVLRFSLQGGTDEATSAVVRYAGRGRELAPLAAELVALQPPPPKAAVAGTKTTLTVRVRNIGRRPWKREGLFPGSLGFRLVSGSRGDVERRGAVPLPRTVRPGETVEIPIIVRWPDRPGGYQLAFDLLREPVGALRGLGRLVLWSAEVVVRSPSSPDIPGP